MAFFCNWKGKQTSRQDTDLSSSQKFILHVIISCLQQKPEKQNRNRIKTWRESKIISQFSYITPINLEKLTVKYLEAQSSSGHDLSQEIRLNMLLYTDNGFDQAASATPWVSTVLWKKSECRRYSQGKHNKKNHVNSSEFSSLRGPGRIKCRHTAAQRAWNSIGLFTSFSIGLVHSGSSRKSGGPKNSEGFMVG